MYELIQVGAHTYYIDNPSKIGVYVTAENRSWLIDSGNDKEAGRKVLRILGEQGWELEGIINTHSNADHVGGNQFLQQRTDCKILSTPIENIFAAYPHLEASFLYGGYPCKALQNKFLLAKPCSPTHNVAGALPQGLESFPLPGHFFDMIGLRTDDDVYFVGDSLFSEALLAKYHLCFIYDVAAFLETLRWLEGLEGKMVIPSHGEATRQISKVVSYNRNKIQDAIALLLQLCKQPMSFEQILSHVFHHYNLVMDFNQHVLIGSTVRSYLAYLYDQGKLDYLFENNIQLWIAR